MPSSTVMTATATRSLPRRSSATWWSTAPLPDPQPPLKDLPARQVDAADAPALRGHDRRQQVERVVAVARRQQALDPEEEARLVGRGDPRVAPDRRRRREVLHPRAAGDAAQPARADDAQDARRRRVVRASDHRREQRAVVCAERPVAHAGTVEVGQHQHRLEHGRGRERPGRAPAPRARGGAHVEGDRAAPLTGVDLRVVDVRAPGSLTRRRRRRREQRREQDGDE